MQTAFTLLKNFNSAGVDIIKNFRIFCRRHILATLRMARKMCRARHPRQPADVVLSAAHLCDVLPAAWGAGLHPCQKHGHLGRHDRAILWSYHQHPVGIRADQACSPTDDRRILIAELAGIVCGRIFPITKLKLELYRSNDNHRKIITLTSVRQSFILLGNSGNISLK